VGPDDRVAVDFAQRTMFVRLEFPPRWRGPWSTSRARVNGWR